MDDSSAAGPPFVGYALRRVAVAPDLDALRGPLQGRWQLPLHIDASSRFVYDFGSLPERELAYRVVLLEAGSHRDHEQWLDRDELLRLWPELYLPRVVRAAWQAEHAVLAQIDAGPHAPQPYGLGFSWPSLSAQPVRRFTCCTSSKLLASLIVTTTERSPTSTSLARTRVSKTNRHHSEAAIVTERQKARAVAGMHVIEGSRPSPTSEVDCAPIRVPSVHARRPSPLEG